MDSRFVGTNVMYSVSSLIRWKIIVKLENRDFVTIIRNFVLNGPGRIGGDGVLASKPSTIFKYWSTTNWKRLDESSPPSSSPPRSYKDNTFENEPAATESNTRRCFVVTTSSKCREIKRKLRLFRFRREKSRQPSLLHDQRKRIPGHVGTCRCRHVPPSNDSAFLTMTERLSRSRRSTNACEMCARTNGRPPHKSFYVIA